MTIKRLLREMFAELLVTKQRLDELTPKEEADDIHTPMEGATLRPHPKPLADGLRYRCKAQVSGTLEYAAIASWAQDAGEAAYHLRQAGVSPNPCLSVYLQSLWGEGKRGLHALLRTDPHDTARQDIQLHKVLLRAELSPGVRVLLAARGSLDNIARSINPFAGSGLTGLCRKGHGLAPAVCAEGMGAAVTLASGAASASVGQFTSGSGTRQDDLLTHRVMQASLHTQDRRLAVSVVAARTSTASSHGRSSSGGRPGHTGDSGCDDDDDDDDGLQADISASGLGGSVCVGPTRQAVLRLLTPRCTALHEAGAATFSGLSPSHLQMGSAAAVRLGESCVLSAWQLRSDAHGNSYGAGLATLPDPVKGNNASVVVARECGGPGRVPSVLAEASASLPLASGVVLTPGLILKRVGGSTCLSVAANTCWRF